MNRFAASFSLLKKILVALAVFAGTLPLFSEPIRYSGSDFLAGDPEKALNAAIQTATAEAPVSRLEGTLSGEKELRAGMADLAVLILPNRGKELPEVQSGKWKVFPLGYQVAYVAVASANPTTSISFSTLASIFGNYAKKQASSWEEAGVSGFGSALTACVGDQSKTDAVSFFQHEVLPNFALKPTVRTFVDDEDVFREILNSPGVIAIVGSPAPSGAPVKMLAVANDESLPGNGANPSGRSATAYPPTFANIYNGDYPLTIPLCVVYPAEKSLPLKPALSFLYSQKMAELLAEAGFLPLENRLREQFQKGIDNIK